MFRTELSVTPSPEKINITDKILTIGSCFSDAIGHQLKVNKFQTQVNPFGTVYNPISIFKLLGYASEERWPKNETYLENDGLHLNYDFHSSFTESSKAELEKRIENSIQTVHEFIKDVDYLIITFGTAFVYKLISSDGIVANCHKVSSKNFSKHLLTQKEILVAFESCYKQLKTCNPDLKIILTVSPVRHIKDTLELNSVSKSTLRLLCHTLNEQYESIDYFPSYELLLDDLRDYRWFKGDMIHPTLEAEEYIWQKLIHAYMDGDVQQFISNWSKIRSALSHRPFYSASPKHQQFIKNTMNKIAELPPELDFSEELSQLRAQLID